MVYASRLFNRVEHNYSITKIVALAMVFALHKFRHYLFGNKFVFYVDHYGIGLYGNKVLVALFSNKFSILIFNIGF
jgi:hypothetical protein